MTQTELKTILHYDEHTGVFTWLVDANNNGAMIGSVAGTLRPTTDRHPDIKRVVICYKRKLYRAHRLAWLYVYGELPEGEIDHIDCDPSNNAISNLRQATREQNCRNVRLRCDNSTGRKGVSKGKRSDSFVARAFLNGKRVYVGVFDSVQAAGDAHDEFLKRHHGEFFRTG